MNPLRAALPLCLIPLLFAISACQPDRKPSAEVVEQMNRGVSLMGQYRYDESVKAFESVLEKAPDLEQAKLNLAIALFNRNGKQDIPASRRWLDELLQNNPGNEQALYFKAILLQHMGEAEQAVPLLVKVVEKKPDDAAAWYVLALCRARIGQDPEADLKKAVALRPNLLSAHYQLYQLLIRAEREEEALKHLEKFQALRQSPVGESIEIPQYNQMGDLALVKPLGASPSAVRTKSSYAVGPLTTIFTWKPEFVQSAITGQPQGAAFGDFNGDGLIDIIAPLGRPGGVVLLQQKEPRKFADETLTHGLASITNAWNLSIGDFDNDEVSDLLITATGRNHLLQGRTNATFRDIPLGVMGQAPAAKAGLFLDVDHDADLDIILSTEAGFHLWSNNGDGTFTNSAILDVGAPGASQGVMAVAGDIDRDRDVDLVLARRGAAPLVVLNHLFNAFSNSPVELPDCRADFGAAVQDFTGDGLLDLLVLSGEPSRLKLLVGNGAGGFQMGKSPLENGAEASSTGPAGFRIGDFDLDGDLDVLTFGRQVELLLNSGSGQFSRNTTITMGSDRRKVGNEVGTAFHYVECIDIDGDLVMDLLICEHGPTNRLAIAYGVLSPKGSAIAIQPSGVRERDGRTRSPASGYGVTVTTRAGLREQTLFHPGQFGGPSQSSAPLVMGLHGAAKADYVMFHWPDGVAQVEANLASGQLHRISELQRKISSCPVLFTWNGSRFEFVTDFAGVGGLGYFVQPGESAPPQVLEHVKIEPNQLMVRDGTYSLRVTEPMEEAAYLDKLELLAIDHPPGVSVFPDERLAITGPPPTHVLLVITNRLYPTAAMDPWGRPCITNLTRTDRVYAYQPQLDRRYLGFCTPHSIELDFGETLGRLNRSAKVHLFVNGYIEYPYSQTVYAARQSRIGWEPIRVEAYDPGDGWRTIIPDAGAPGGMGRTMTIGLSEHLRSTTTRLRLTTNLEIFYDEIFAAADAGSNCIQSAALPLRKATLRYAGFAREFSPDGHLPLIYDYHRSDPTAPFHTLKGAYTRYGNVEQLLAEFDDQFAILGPGDEVALEFDATAAPQMPNGSRRSFILMSHAYCKDMDLYTAASQTLEPLPSKAMTRYPYLASESVPISPAQRAYAETYNTRMAGAANQSASPTYGQ